MKRLYMIGGPMGVGKTAACRQLQQLLDRSLAYLPLYDALDIRHLDVTALTPRETAECIRREGGA